MIFGPQLKIPHKSEFSSMAATPWDSARGLEGRGQGQESGGEIERKKDRRG